MFCFPLVLVTVGEWLILTKLFVHSGVVSLFWWELVTSVALSEIINFTKITLTEFPFFLVQQIKICRLIKWKLPFEIVILPPPRLCSLGGSTTRSPHPNYSAFVQKSFLGLAGFWIGRFYVALIRYNKFLLEIKCIYQRIRDKMIIRMSGIVIVIYSTWF
jgi:hypothetical protein